jgi:FkbM family methyltransferase
MTQLKLLLLDLTRMGGSAATGVLKQTIFGAWPDHDFAHVHGIDERKLALRTGASSILGEKPFSINDGKLEEACRAFDPDVILYRPVADHEAFHGAAMRIIKSSQSPLALWLMDDWPERLKAEDADRHDLLDKDLRWLFGYSSVNFAISDGMARAFGERYGVSFGVIHNGVNPVDWPSRRRSWNDPTVLLRYAGSLAPDTTRDSILRVAAAVSQMVEQGAPIRFEGQTQKVWQDRFGSMFQGLSGVSMRVAKLEVGAYRQWLCDADIVLIGYNFDEETKRYLRFSFANKVPETLASGAAVLAHGPAGLQTIDYLAQQDFAKVVSEPNMDMLKSALTDLIKDKHMRESLGRGSREHAFDVFNLAKQRNKMTAALRDISQQWTPPGSVIARNKKAQFDECKFVYEALGARNNKGVMIDVGAHVGSSLIAFAKAGWNIWAFEPDPHNRQKLHERVKNRSNVRVINKAVSAEAKTNVAFYSSNVSTGISGLTAFHESHEESARIDSTTLDIFVSEYQLQEVDFLKIDVEGHEMDVLNGLDFGKIKPRAIVAEFEDEKTKMHGYRMPDLARHLEDAGYVVFVSEWHPIERYGIKHSWKKMRRYPCDTPPTAWGNLVAFLVEPEPKMLRRAFQKALTLENEAGKIGGKKLSESRTASATPAASGFGTAASSRSLYIRAAEHLIQRHPVLAQFLRFGVWSLRTLGRRIIGIGGISVVALLLPLTAVFIRPELWALWLGIAGLSFSGTLAFLLVGYIRYIFLRREDVRNAKIRTLEESTKRLSRQLTKAQVNLERLERRSLTFEDMAVRRMKVNAKEARLYTNDMKERLKKWFSGSNQQTLAHIEKYETRQNNRHEKTAQVTEVIKKRINELNKQSTEFSRVTVKEARSSRVSLLHMSNSNAALLRPHVRQLSQVNIKQFMSFWLGALGLDLTKSQLAYLAHKICIAEDAAAGRLAAPVETILLRLLASHSLKGGRLEILEIGTLFGIGAACLSKFRTSYEQEIQLTLLDPMEGYYEHGSLDPVTGVPVSEAVLRDNLAQLGVADDQWRLIKKLSTEPEAREAAGDRHYDMLIIDGDHTVEGVARDFELYADLVKEGGLLIFDDYDTEDWPDIKPYVDENVKPDDRWHWIGGEFRTGIFRRKD